MAKRKRPDTARERITEAVTIAPVKSDINTAPTGKEWEVTIIGAESPDDVRDINGVEYIKSKNGLYYSATALASSAPLWEGIKVYDNHIPDDEYPKKAGRRSVAEEWIGTLVKPVWDAAAKKLKATFKVVDKALSAKLLAAHDAKVLDTIGLSIDTVPQRATAYDADGKSLSLMQGFKKIWSADLVAEPAAGGGFNRLIASVNEDIEIDEIQDEQQENIMTPEEIKAALAEGLAEGLASIKEFATRLDALEASNQQEAEGAEEDTESEDAAATEADDSADEDGQEDTPDKSAQESLVDERFRQMESGLALERTINQAKLSEASEALARQAYGNRTFDQADLDKFIGGVQESQAASDPTGRVTGAGATKPAVKVGLDASDKYELAVMRKIMGDREFRAIESNEDYDVKSRVTESYKAWIKDSRPNIDARRLSHIFYEMLGGDPFQSDRAYEAVTTSNMSSIVKNTLNLKLAADYSQREQWWTPFVVEEEVDNLDDATLVRVYGVNTLSKVSPGAPYQELDWEDEEEVSIFQKRGNYIGVHLEALLQDKLNMIRSIPSRLANSWFNTLSDLVADVFTTNTAAGPVLGTTGALFNATAPTTAGGHGNLLTTALSYGAYSAARTAMMKQTDKTLGTGRKLLITPRYLLVPVDLEATAEEIRTSTLVPAQSGGATTGGQFQTESQFAGQFQTIVVPPWTDTNNWALVADKAAFPAIYLIFLRGARVPSLFTSDQETQGSMFTNDELRYKVRQMTWRFDSTYDVAPVADFRPLHKSNV
ncbi:MAG: hypothetical protein V3R81_00940 [Gammaproteobacteria bacterium]